jgi:hypothetical protein
VVYDPACDDKNLDIGNDVTYRNTIREPKTGLVPDPPRIDLTSSTIRFEMKKQPEKNRLKQTDPVVVTKTSDDANEIEILAQSGDTLGQCKIKLRRADTLFLQPGTYAYSVEVTTAAGLTRTVTKGRFFLKGAATTAENQTPPD